VLARESRVRLLEDWSDAPALFDAAVYPSLVVVERALPGAVIPSGREESRCRVRLESGGTSGFLPLASARGRNDDGRDSALRALRSALDVTIRVHGAAGAREWRTPAESLAFDDTAGSPWLLVPPAARDALARLRAAGTPLGSSGLGRLLLGVKCGCNAAFVVRAVGDDGAVASVEGTWPDGARRHGLIERALLRPVLRGESLHAPDAGERVIWPYDARGRALRTLPPNAAQWFAPWRARLAARSDARSDAGGPWWALFRTAAAAADRPRLVWADVARGLRPRLLGAGDPAVPLNSCYAFACSPDDAPALAALLASPVADAWCAALAEPARGGYRRHLAWTVALLPVPQDWMRARALLAADASLDALAAAYGLPLRALRALAGDVRTL
jgi:hypothetical protein